MNNYGQLGNSTNDATSAPNPTPTLVALPGATGPVTQVADGGHTLAVTSTGQLYAFGNNGSGQLGNTTNNNVTTPNPAPTSVTLPGATGPVVDVAAGGSHSLVVTSTGQLYSFGDNSSGQLGITANSGTFTPNPTPTLVNLSGATGPVVQVAAGDLHSLALTSTGQLYAFGDNRYGELGNSTHNSTGIPNPTPTPVILSGATGPVVQVAAGGLHSLALTSSGQLYAFGYNAAGQLGNTTNSGTGIPNPTPTPVTLPGATGVVARVAGGGNHSLVVTSTGQLYAFGNNHSGQLGNATNNGTSLPNPTPALVTLAGATGAPVQVAAGFSHSLAVTSTGQLYAFGDNNYGQLGTATNNATGNPNPTPTLVALPGAATIDTVALGSNADDSLAVVANLAVTSSSLPSGTTGVPYSAQVRSGGGAPAYSWSATGLPPGLSINPASGLISGTPTSTGSYSPTVTVTDSDHISAPGSFAITIAAAGPPTLSGLAVSPHRLSAGGRLVKGHCLRLTRANRRHRYCIRQIKLHVSFKLTAATSVMLTLQRTSTGRLVNGRCVVATRSNRKRRHCARLISVPGSVIRQAQSGANTITITTLFAGRALRPGTYQLTAATTTTAGPTGTARTAVFRITP